MQAHEKCRCQQSGSCSFSICWYDVDSCLPMTNALGVNRPKQSEKIKPSRSENQPCICQQTACSTHWLVRSADLKQDQASTTHNVNTREGLCHECEVQPLLKSLSPPPSPEQCTVINIGLRVIHARTFAMGKIY